MKELFVFLEARVMAQERNATLGLYNVKDNITLMRNDGAQKHSNGSSVLSILRRLQKQLLNVVIPFC